MDEERGKIMLMCVSEDKEEGQLDDGGSKLSFSGVCGDTALVPAFSGSRAGQTSFHRGGHAT